MRFPYHPIYLLFPLHERVHPPLQLPLQEPVQLCWHPPLQLCLQEPVQPTQEKAILGPANTGR